MTAEGSQRMKLDNYNASWDIDYAKGTPVSTDFVVHRKKPLTQEAGNLFYRETMCRSSRCHVPGGTKVEKMSADQNFESFGRGSDHLHGQPTSDVSQGFGDTKTKGVIFQQDLACNNNNYLKEYQQKYGKLGIFRDGDFQGDELSPAKSRCFPFLRDHGKTTTKDLVSSLALATPASGWTQDSAPLGTSPWDPSTCVTPEGQMSKHQESTIGESAGKGWRCLVYDKDKENIPDEGGGSQAVTGQCEGTPIDSHQDNVEHNQMPSQSPLPYTAEPGAVEYHGALTNTGSVDDRLKRGPLRQSWAHRLQGKTGSPLQSAPGRYFSDSVDGYLLNRADHRPPEEEESNFPDNQWRRGSRPRGGRRSVSDLGFTLREPGIVATPRTAALMRNPAFRKHLARNLGVDDHKLDDRDFQYDFKLQLLNNSCSSPTSTDLADSVARADGSELRKRLLKTSLAESLRSRPSCLLKGSDPLTQPHLSPVNPSEPANQAFQRCTVLQEDFPSTEETVSCSLQALSVQKPDFYMNIAKGKFHIPTFDEFRQSQRTRTHASVSPSQARSFSFDFMLSNTIEEEPETEDMVALQKGPEEDEVAGGLPQGSPHGEAVSSSPQIGKHDAKLQTPHLLQEEEEEADIRFTEQTDPLFDLDSVPNWQNPEVELDENDLRRSLLRASKLQRRERRSKRSSHPPRLERKGQGRADLQSPCEGQECVAQPGLPFSEGAASNGRPRKEGRRRQRSNSEGNDHTRKQDRNVFDGHQEVKLIKQFKIRDSSKGHSSDSKLMVVMVKDDAKDNKTKDKNSDRPQRPERHRHKRAEAFRKEPGTRVNKEEGELVSSKDMEDPNTPKVNQQGQYISEVRQEEKDDSKDSKKEPGISEELSVQAQGISEATDEDKLKRDISKATRASRRSKSRTKKERGSSSHKHCEPEGLAENCRDSRGEGKPRRSTRSSGKRRGSRNAEQNKEEVAMEKEPTSDLGAEEEDDEDASQMGELPHFPSSRLNYLLSDNVMVTRSVSDISDKLAEDQRKKGGRDRRQKLYKSDPFHGPGGEKHGLPTPSGTGKNGRQRHLAGQTDNCSSRTRDEVLTFLNGVQRHVESPPEGANSTLSLNSLEELNSEDGPTGVERVDSGVGAELKDGTSSKEFKGGLICEDCEGDLSDENMSSSTDFLCTRCESRRVERKETIQEIVDTEVSYGKDLNIVKEEFYMPMKSAGLLSPDQLEAIFSNLEELSTISERFADDLLDALDLSNEQGDEDYTTVNIGQLFLDASSMLLAFETYCVNQASVPQLLEKFEVEKELLRIFLHVSQRENSLLRRMDLKAFLMVPVQRIMKYPLLLSRLYKVTAPHHVDRQAIRKAQNKMEDILEHINAQSSRNNASMRLKRKISGIAARRTTADDIEINKLAIEILGWNRKDVNFILTGRLQYTQPNDHLWMKKGRTFKYTPIYALLITLGRGSADRWAPGLLFPRPTGVKEAALVLIKEKGGKFLSVRDPLYLDRCVVSMDAECKEVFEVMDSSMESFLFKGEDSKDTQAWLHHLKLQTKDLGQWRRRRNALPNIMIQNMTGKS